MERSNTTDFVLTLVIGVLYAPLSLFGLLMQMKFDGSVGATNPAFLWMERIYCGVSSFFPLLCAAGILLCVVFRKQGRRGLSLFCLFLPLAVFILNFLLLVWTDFVPKYA